MIKKILVSTDGSDYSRRALSTAIEYAKQFNSEIELFHVVSQPPPGMYDYTITDYIPISEERGNEMGEQILNATLKGMDVSQVIVSKKTVTGYPASEIIDEIKRGFDLVVMGSRGHRPLVGAVLGSVTQRVLADAPCPVLVVK